MRTDEVRERFLKFFEARGHCIVPSAPLVPAGDPTLLFTGAGMNQFKEYFLGTRRDLSRAASCQICLRTPDLAQVGKTPGHHTFFEMLGNFSFGDYFKKEAILWAWEFLTRELSIPEPKLSVSVYQDDEESYEIWRKDVGLVEQGRIRRLGAEENFWPANAREEGPDGPCGPCSEIYYEDMEVWNLVFTQFERKSDKSLAPLPKKNIDTGMGLERLACVLQGKKTNFEIDIFEPIVEKVLQGFPKGQRSGEDRMHAHAIADHARAIAFAVAEGVAPSNEGRGYVIRKLIRLCMTHAWYVSGSARPFLHQLVIPEVVRVMGSSYPALRKEEGRIRRVVEQDEASFSRIFVEGENRWHEEARRLQAKGCGAADPEFVFRLHDTHGFPFEASLLLAQKRGLALDVEAVERLFGKQRERSRQASQISEAVFDPKVMKGAGLESRFLGYGTARASGRVLALFEEGDRRVDELRQGARSQVVLNETPFYAEQGGQIGDRGVLNGPQSARFEVEDTQYAGSAIVHVGRVAGGTFRVGDTVEAEVDDERRWHIRRNHTATHLLHAALREVLGKEVRQAGSLVSDEKLRFDFNYPRPVAVQDLDRVERLVNQKILENHEVGTREMEPQAAQREGAIAFFGEKYGERVRVVDVPGFSKELCGGTHCRRTGDIGLFRIVSEGSVGQGMRRIEAVTGWGVFDQARRDGARVREVAGELNVAPDKSAGRVRELVEQVKNLEREVSRLRTGAGSGVLDTLLKNAVRVGEMTLVAGRVDGYGLKELRDLSDRLRERTPRSVTILGSSDGEKATVIVSLSRDLKDSTLDAGLLASAFAERLGGSGGGRRDFAQAGGKDPSKLDEALKAARTILEQQLRRGT
ncbi:MAG: alanine--tRNA ligase [Candidatus Omnitrophica bacterium]|nr:alanine--tRNA ligase [Candidatus Omnitrophota bacterium]